jgi:hypothetical protein
MPRAQRFRITAAASRSLPPGTTAALITLTLLVAGCGSSYSRQDFVDRANGICANAVRQTRAIPSSGAPQKNRALAEYLTQALPIAQSEADQLRALRRPPGTDREKAALTKYFSALTQQVTAIRRLKTAAAGGDSQGVAIAEAALTATQASSLAAKYGLRSCANPGATAV